MGGHQLSAGHGAGDGRVCPQARGNALSPASADTRRGRTDRLSTPLASPPRPVRRCRSGAFPVSVRWTRLLAEHQRGNDNAANHAGARVASVVLRSAKKTFPRRARDDDGQRASALLSYDHSERTCSYRNSDRLFWRALAAYRRLSSQARVAVSLEAALIRQRRPADWEQRGAQSLALRRLAAPLQPKESSGEANREQNRAVQVPGGTGTGSERVSAGDRVAREPVRRRDGGTAGAPGRGRLRSLCGKRLHSVG
jgi:hypothetical protein